MSTGSRSFTRRMSTVVDKLRRGVAKTIQAASENEVYDTLPDCEDLLLANKFTVKVYELPADASSPSASYFKPVHFEVIAKRTAGGTFFVGELVAGQGIVLKTAKGKIAMDIRLPENSRTYMGKILHPAGATLYKVELGKTMAEGSEWHVSKNGQQILNFVSTPMKEVFGILENLVRCCVCMNGEYSLDFYNLDCQSIGFVRPSLFTTNQSIELEYKEGRTTRDERAAILGASLLFLIVYVYPHYAEVLEKSLPQL